MNTTKKWTKTKIEEFKKSYSILSKKEIMNKFPDCKWRNLQNIAAKLKVKKKFSEIRNGKIEKLFNNTIESYYWLGLIVTDGSITKDGTLKIDLCVKDYNYLKKLALFLETTIKKYPPYKGAKPNSKGICRVKIKDIENGNKLRLLLKIENKKTYNPISIEFIKTKDELLSFLCGYIDGDGTITKKHGIIHVDAHKNYEYFMNIFGKKLLELGCISDYSITKYKNMVRLNFLKKDSIGLKKEMERLKLPLMKRKWNKIKYKTKA